MGNTIKHGMQTIYNVLLTLNILNANKEKVIAAETHWIVKRVAKFNQLVHFELYSLQNGSQKICSVWKKLNICFHSIYSKLINIGFNQ